VAGVREIGPLAAVLLLGSVAAQQAPHDWLIVPGVRVGPITASSTEAGLREVFGTRNVHTRRADAEVVTGLTSTLIYSDPSKALGISWAGIHPEAISFCFGHNEEAGAWKTSSGIRCGTTLRELEAFNGRPFTLSGYSGDRGGTVLSWDGGRLDAELGGALKIAVAPRGGRWRDGLSYAALAKLNGATVQSDDATLQELNPSVYSMTFRFVRTNR